jgi:peptidoglycan hydrolase-like protein with peptidoglycan-binding domain
MFIFHGNVFAQNTAVDSETQLQVLQRLVAELQANVLLRKTATQLCPALTQTLSLGSSDALTAGEVSMLQRFLTSTGHYTEPEITGFFGPATQRAVQAWQAANSVVRSGSPETTGFGVVGTQTRAAMLKSCVQNSEQRIPPSVAKSDMSITSVMRSLRALAEIHYDSNRTTRYDNFCTSQAYREIVGGLGSTSQKFRCNDAKDQYAISVQLAKNSYQCIDSTGFSGEVRNSVGSKLACNTESRQSKTTKTRMSGKPDIVLTSPLKNTVYDKSVKNDDVIFSWRAKNVPPNTNVVIAIETIKLEPGSVIGGGTVRVRAENGSGEYRYAIDTPGRMDPGTYKVRLLLRECHPAGCQYSYTPEQTKQLLKEYDSSAWGYFTVVRGSSSSTKNVPSNSRSTVSSNNKASVRMLISGFSDSERIKVDLDKALDVLYYPQGAVDECKIIGRYNNGSTRVVEHSWANGVKTGQYGKQTFLPYGMYPASQLLELKVDCLDTRGKIVATDSIKIDLNSSEQSDLELFVGTTRKLHQNVTEVEARSMCSQAANALENRGVRVRCEWDEKTFFDEVNWKG